MRFCATESREVSPKIGTTNGVLEDASRTVTHEETGERILGIRNSESTPPKRVHKDLRYLKIYSGVWGKKVLPWVLLFIEHKKGRWNRSLSIQEVFQERSNARLFDDVSTKKSLISVERNHRRLHVGSKAWVQNVIVPGHQFRFFAI